MSILGKILFYINKRLKPIDTARKLGVHIGENCSFASMPNFGSEPYLITLGNHVRTSSEVTFITHDGATWCFREQDKYRKVLRFGRIYVGNNCFLGYRSIILPGVHIGNNCIVAAGAVVTKNVPDGCIVGGVPAKVISTTEKFAEKCLDESPDWNEEAMKQNKRKEIERVIGK